MEKEIDAITQRLDHMQGVLLAQQVFLVAIAQDLRQKDWSCLFGMDNVIDKYMGQLRHSPASDLTLSAFQQTLAQLRESLSGVVSENHPF